MVGLEHSILIPVCCIGRSVETQRNRRSRDYLIIPSGRFFSSSRGLGSSRLPLFGDRSLAGQTCDPLLEFLHCVIFTFTSLSFPPERPDAALSDAVTLAAGMARQQPMRAMAHMFAFAEPLSQDGRLPLSLPGSVWLSRAATMAETFAIPFAFYFKPVVVFIAMFW